MKNIIVYGIGKNGKELVDTCLYYEIPNIKLVDTNKGGEEYNGKKIFHPYEIEWDEQDMIILAVGDKLKTEIKKNLINIYGVPNEKIYSMGQFMCLSNKEIYNIGHMSLDFKEDSGVIMTGKEFGAMQDENNMNDLEKFFFNRTHKNIDKWMHYFEAYDRFFSRYRGKNVTILEIGVFKGGSLQMWKDYFRLGDNRINIYGIDINPECKILEEEGINIFIGSQEDRNFLRKIKKEIGKVDILIDDGGHTMEQQIITFEELFDLVDDNGIYLCEDLHTSYMKSYGGEYKGNTFIEYSKNLIDYLHAQYSESKDLESNIYSEKIKYITYCDSMIFIEKKKKTTKSIHVEIK